MTINKGKNILTKNDFDEYPIWSFHDDDLIYPVKNKEDFPEDSFKLLIKTSFKSPNGLSLDGFIMGVENIYCIAIYWKGDIFYLNKNLRADCIKIMEKIISDDNKKNINECFPMKFTTIINLPQFKNISGFFDIFKPMSDKERLDFDWKK